LKLLITGGSGFIGTHTAKAALESGFEVRILDISQPKLKDNNVEYFEGDILSKESCANAVQGCDKVLHLAAYSRSGPSIEMWSDCLETNINGTINMLEASLKEKVSKFVYAGSSTFYGNNLGVQKVGDTGDFLNFYGLSKYVGEELTNQFSKNLGLNTTNLRYFNVYGVGQPTEGAHGLVMGFFAEARKHGLKVEIHGTGEQRRDFIHVKDVANANLAALGNLKSGMTYNVGSGINTSINELAEIFQLQAVHTKRRTGDAEITLADIEDTVQDLNWKPEIPLDEGILDL
jgi:nucleoside-diphosphate-sugar epimerase